MGRSPYPESLARLIDQLNHLPGIGKKSAERLALYLVQVERGFIDDLSRALVDVAQRVHLCSECCNLTETKICTICADPRRNRNSLCVVESSADVMALENTGEFNGLYHVLHGAVAPLEGRRPEDLKIRELVERLERQKPKEIILALSPNVEGDATAHALMGVLKGDFTVSRLAAGIPIGGALVYSDSATLGRALSGRQRVQ